MTTIAWDGKTLAVDGRMSEGDTISNESIKKLFLNIGQYKAVAISGKYGQMLEFVEWLKNEDSDSFPEAEGRAICIDRKGKLYEYQPKQCKIRFEPKTPYSDGSGWLIALGAMDAGATAVEAVKIAIRRDVYTGGKIKSYTHKG